VSFPRLLHAEWTKFRTVRGWVAGTVVAALTVVLVALLAGVSSDLTGAPPVPIGPGGESVTDSLYLVHRPLTGDGSVTVAVAALRTGIPAGPGGLRPGVVPWAKAGLVIRQNSRPGSPYAAIMITGSHGVRMQHDYVHDVAAPGTADGPARWLRLARAGDAITGSTSADGLHWTEVATVHMQGLGADAYGGLFVASPPAIDGIGTRGSVSTAEFGRLGADGDWADGDWTGEQVGGRSATFAGYPENTTGSFTEAPGAFTVTGAGDMAPATRQTLATGGTLKDLLTGTLAALIAVIVVGTQFITTEYRQNLIHVTLAATPRRGRTLLAKATVLGGVTFAAGLAATPVAVVLGRRLASAGGVHIFPVTTATGLRVVLGTAALLAVTSVLALAVGAIVRRGAEAVTAVVVAIVLPCVLIGIPFLPAGVADLLARATSAAAFAVQQTLVRHDHVDSIYTPYNGYYPLTPWAGLAVLAGYTAVALAVAVVLIRRRDA
jgi:ABC-type transport system involved in multi-copper enzyme maturation permease subunit